MTLTVIVKLDQARLAWVSGKGLDPAGTLMSLLDDAIRKDLLADAKRAERDIELLIRRRETQLERQGVGDARAQAEREILRASEDAEDDATRRAAQRVRLHCEINSAGTGEERKRLRARLQRMRTFAVSR